MNIWIGILCVFGGSGLGGVLRYLTGLGLSAVWPGDKEWALPWNTLLVNIAGCFIIGAVYGACNAQWLSPQLRTALTAGFCGGLTTFSAFGYETFAMVAEGRLWAATGYTVLSVAAGVLASGIGYSISR